VKALTVQQPWAWAIVHGGKDVENRTQAWGYRGPLAIHAGQRWSHRGGASPLVRSAFGLDPRSMWPPEHFPLGAIIGVVDLVDAHTAQVAAVDHVFERDVLDVVCCHSEWAEASYDEHGGSTRRDVVHLVLANPRPLDVPVPCTGRLGLWTPDADVLEQLQAVTA
jgi:hypothetical protein